MECIFCGSWFGSSNKEDKVCSSCEQAIRKLCLDMSAGRLAELAKAEKAGRLVVLPCKVGDSYFSVEKFCDEHGELDGLQEHSGSDCEFCCILCNAELRVVEHKFWNIQSILSRKGCIGKTVFLTRQEAEAALRKEDGNG